MNARILSIILASFFLVFIFDLVRRERLTFKYAAGWILVTLGGLGLAIFDKVLGWLVLNLGFKLPSNFVFFVAISGLVFLSILLTIFLCQQNVRNDRMAQKIGILENEILNLQKKIRNESPSNTER